jgi:hypothetical protein
MSSMTPVYDSVASIHAGGVMPAVPRHPDIYQQLCGEHGEVLDGPRLAVETGTHDPTLTDAAPLPVPSDQPGWFEPSVNSGRRPASDTGWFAA